MRSYGEYNARHDWGFTTDVFHPYVAEIRRRSMARWVANLMRYGNSL